MAVLLTKGISEMKKKISNANCGRKKKQYVQIEIQIKDLNENPL